MSKDKIVILLGSFLIITIFLAGFFFFSNASLKAEVAANKNTSEEKIATLEKKLNALSDDPVLTTSPKEEEESNAAPPSSNAPKVMTEEELLKNYFTQPPTLIMPDESPTKTPEPKTDSNVSGPVLSVLPAVADLGTISKQSGVATANFELKNTGKSDLTINYALTSCGCTLAPLKEEKIVKPGESFVLPVTYDPNFYGPSYELGPIEKTVTIFSNYAAEPFYKVKLKANVTP